MKLLWIWISFVRKKVALSSLGTRRQISIWIGDWWIFLCRNSTNKSFPPSPNNGKEQKSTISCHHDTLHAIIGAALFPSIDLGKYWSYEDGTRLKMKRPTRWTGPACQRRLKPTASPSSLQSWPLSEESDDEIHQKAAEPAYATARHYRKSMSMAISNNSTAPETLSSRGKSTRTIVIQHKKTLFSSASKTNWNLEPQNCSHDTTRLRRVGKLHLQADLNGAIPYPIPSTYRSTAATAQ